MCAVHQCLQRRYLLFLKMITMILLDAHLQRIVQKYLMDLDHIFRWLHEELSLILMIGADDPEHEFCFRHLLYEIMHPAGNTAVCIGVASLQNKTNAHSFSCYFPRCILTSLPVVCRRYRFPVRCSSVPPSSSVILPSLTRTRK